MEGRLSKIVDYFKQFSSNELRTKKIPNLFFVCGGNGTEKGQIRDELIDKLRLAGHKVVKPEDFLQYNNGQLFKKDLLELERYYAALVSLIPISCESYGSAAELGAFVNDEFIRKKLFVIIRQEFYDNNESFIANGLIKNFEFNIGKYDRKKRVYATTGNPNDEINDIIEEIINYSFISSKCDFKNPYFQIQLLITIINAKIISDKTELKNEFKQILEMLDGTFEEENFDEMISVCKHLKKIYEISLGTSRFYVADESYTYLERDPDSASKPQKLTLNFPQVRNSYFEEIYKNNSIEERKKKKFLEERKQNVPLTWQKVDIQKFEVGQQIIFKAPLMYKTYSIPKKSGGVREISQPTAIIKELQRKALTKLEDKLPIHTNAMAYIKGKNGICVNGETHKQNKYFYKFDFKDFFPSIKATHLINLLKYNGFSEEEISKLSLLFLKINKNAHNKNVKAIMKRLSLLYMTPNASLIQAYEIINQNADIFEISIGAPSSPFLSNAIMYNFDKEITEQALNIGLIYSRFADDITFSSTKKIDINDIKELVLNTLKKTGYDYILLNEKKQKFVTFKQRVQITGINITPNHKISIGRNNKKLISAMVHKFSISKLNDSDIMKLKGWLSYIKSVEISFIKSLNMRYGTDIISKIFNFNLPN